MKKLFLSSTLILAGLLLFCACNQPLSSRFDELVAQTEEKCAGYSNEDWLKATDRFGELYAEFKSTTDDITPNDKKTIEADIDKFLTLVIRSENSVAMVNLKQYYDDPGGLFYLRVKDYLKSISDKRLTPEILHNINSLFEEYDEARESISEGWREKVESELLQYKDEIVSYLDSLTQEADNGEISEDKGIVEKVKDFFKKLF